MHIRTDLENTVNEVLSSGDLFVLDPALLGQEGPARLVYRVIGWSTPVALLGGYVFVDARTGDVLHLESRLRNADRYIYDSQNGFSYGGATLERSEGQGATSDADVDDNYEALGAARNYFNTNFGWTSFDDASADIKSYVYWGTAPYAAWDGGNDNFHFGTDDYARAADIVGHEYAHAVLDYAWAGHGSTGETGAIAESLADLFGELIQWTHATPTTNWLIGEDVTGGPLRDMADPAEYGQPGWTGSTLYYAEDDGAHFVYTNAGIINHFWYLMSQGGTYRDITVPGLDSISGIDGPEAVAELAWHWLTNGACTTDGFRELYTGIRESAETLYETSGDLEDVLETIDRAAEATGIDADLFVEPDGSKSTDPYESIYYIRNEKWYSGGPFWLRLAVPGKSIPYKIYVPIDGKSMPNGRGYVQWPLDVILLSHGAGQNREVAAGYDEDALDEVNEVKNEDDFEALATLWARNGYIVVAPTHTKRRKIGSFDWRWETPQSRDSIEKAATDLRRVSMDATEFYADRIHELKAILDDLDVLINVTDADGAYDPQVSRVALAGHSLGAVTVQLAAGQIMRDVNDDVIDLTDEGLSRIGSDVGPFIDADAFLAMSGEEYAEPEQLFVLNPAKPAISGLSYIQRPFMMTNGSLDILQTTEGGMGGDAESDAAFYDPITKAAGISDAPSYGVVIDEANHLTPVAIFDAPLDTIYAWVPEGFNWTTHFKNTYIDTEHLTAQESEDLDGGDHEEPVKQLVNLIIGDRFGIVVPQQQARDQMADGLLLYTLSFWDAFLGQDYDVEAAVDFLNRHPEEHMNQNIQGNQVFRFARTDGIFGFASSLRTTAWTVKDASNDPLLHLTSDGNLLVMTGTFTHGVTSLAASSNRELVIKSNAGTVLMIVDATSGNVKIRGSLTTDDFSLVSTSDPEFIVRTTQDTEDEAQAVLTEGGNLKLRGSVFDSKEDILDP